MRTAEELAQLIRDTLHDRLENDTQSQLAFETAALRAYVFSMMDELEHIAQHLQRGEIFNSAEMQETMLALIRRLMHRMANLEDARIVVKELDAQDARAAKQDDSNDPHIPS